jgi:hypothetical protein
MGVKISNLPAIVAPALTDIFPVVQAGVTYKETVTQLATLLGTIGVTTITGTAHQVIASASTGPVVLSTPQDIDTTSNVTFGSVTFSPTTKGIVGTPTNNNAGAGFVGEFKSSTIVSGSAISLTTTVVANLTSISLTAGDWDVFGNVFFTNTGTASSFEIGISTTSATPPNTEFVGILSSAAFDLTGSFAIPAPQQRMSLSGTTTVYMIVRAEFNTGAVTACGGIYARRVR